MTSETLTQKWEAAFTYAEYKDLMVSLVRTGKTTGPDQSEERVRLTALNDQHMKRLDKGIKLDAGLISALRNISGNYGWLVLTETWCSDAAWLNPILNKMAEQTPNLLLRFLLRDEHLDLMEEFRTGVSQSIPKLITFNFDQFKVIGSWGPRPEPAQRILRTDRNHSSVSYEQTLEKIEDWYRQDEGKTIQREFTELIPRWEEAVFATERQLA